MSSVADFMKPFIAFILAILIANPMCCCAFGYDLSSTSSPVSCCSVTAADSKEDAPDQQPCGCLTKADKAIGQEAMLRQPAELTNPDRDLLHPAAEILPAALSEEVKLSLSKRASDALEIPLLGERLAHLCVYLL